MASPVIVRFHAAVAAGLSPEDRKLLRNAVGSGPATRDIHRPLILATRAAEWADAAVHVREPGRTTRYADVGVIGRPETADEQLWPAARDERARAASIANEELHAIANLVIELAGSVSEIDTEATYEQNVEAFTTAAHLAGRVLTQAGAIKRAPAWTIARANEVLVELINLGDWVNQLGPRFD